MTGFGFQSENTNAKRKQQGSDIIFVFFQVLWQIQHEQ
jgi:predicted extracellular nuclease